MIIEFKHVRTSLEEEHERYIKAELQGETSVPFQREDDYIAPFFLEMDDVLDFVEGTIWWNDQNLPCVYVRRHSESITCNILISGVKFKELLEKVRNIQIKTAEEILNE